MVARLLKDSNAALALEVASGGKLYNVIVDNEHTGSKLLAKGKLRRRVTIIPLNKIAPREISTSRLEAASRLGGGRHAVSLVGYPEELDAAMKHVFGGVIICKDLDSAKRCTFDSRCAMRSVTLEGDAFDPSGTLSGGASSGTQGSRVLRSLSELHNLHEEIQRMSAQLAEAEKLASARGDIESALELGCVGAAGDVAFVNSLDQIEDRHRSVRMSNCCWACS